MIEFNFNKSEQILYVECSGKIEINDMFKYVKKLGNDDTLPRKLLIIEDARKSDVQFTEKQLPELVTKLEDILPKYKTIRHSVIHSDPLNTAYAIILDNNVEKENYRLKVFSTVQAAKKWLII